MEPGMKDAVLIIYRLDSVRRGLNDRDTQKKHESLMPKTLGLQVPAEVRCDWGGCQEGPVIPAEKVFGALGP